VVEEEEEEVEEEVEEEEDEDEPAPGSARDDGAPAGDRTPVPAVELSAACVGGRAEEDEEEDEKEPSILTRLLVGRGVAERDRQSVAVSFTAEIAGSKSTQARPARPVQEVGYC
jgi:hypothetical protein